jgi:2,5-diketo-D-gluconate reductase B
MAFDLPSPGLGTSGNRGETCRQAVREALEIGYRHIDTAQMYGNEAAVGAAIRESGVDREDVVVATKIHPRNLAYEDAKRTARESLDRLGLDTVDLLYVHWPITAYDPPETLRAMDELREEGVTRHVVVSNFTPSLLDEARELLDSPIVANQVECHPLLQQEELRAYAREHGHHLVAYAPLGGAKLTHPVLESIAEKHGVSVPLVCLAWTLSLPGVVPIPKATGEHVRENWAARELELEEADHERIAAIEETRRLFDRDGMDWE